MKKSYLFLMLLMSLLGKAQVINFADPDFKAALLANPSCAQDMMGEPIVLDTNGNGEIEVSEAVLAERIIIHDSAVSDLGGIEFFTTVNHLDFSDCSVTAFNPAPGLPLVLFYCSNNSLTQLDLSMYPIAELICANNQLTSLNLSNLVLGKLDCSNNQLSSLTATLDLVTEFLVMFDCSNNQLETLNVHGDLHQINCQGNQLQELDLSQCRFQYVNTSDNLPLRSINIKNGAIDFAEMIFTITDFATLPNLDYLCTDQNEMQDFQNLVAPLVPGLEVNTYCSLVPGGTYYNFTGQVRYDFNIDGCDATDVVLPFQPFNANSNGNLQQFYTDVNGQFDFPLPAGTHEIYLGGLVGYYFSFEPPGVSLSTEGMTGPIVQDFCVSSAGISPDLTISLIPLSDARPGFASHYRIVCQNVSATAGSGTVSLTFDDNALDFVSASPAQESIANGMITWQFQNLTPFSRLTFDVLFDVNAATDTPPINDGDILQYQVNVVTDQADSSPQNNVANLSQTVVNSLDPNKKSCLEGSVLGPQLGSRFLHYLIRFENTGTANATNVVIRDVIDTDKFEIFHLTPVEGSHPFTTRIYDTNKVEFIFENINLPFDDAHNDGFVVFKIRTLGGLVLGDTFSNSASIYFDYNFPIVTNTATTTIQLLGTPDFAFSDAFVLYPNPVSNALNIQSKNGLTVDSVSIYNTLGQLLMVETGAADVDVSSLQAGQYFVKANTNKGFTVTTFIKK